MDVSEPVRNPLFGAIYGGHTDVARLLIDSGIDTNIKYNGKNMKEMDALAFAREWGRTDIADLLVKRRKSMEKKSQSAVSKRTKRAVRGQCSKRTSGRSLPPGRG